MRCARVEKLIDRYVDGTLPPARAREVAGHESRCPRCTARIQTARGLAAALSEGPALKAPAAFLETVMDQVYREALAGSRATRGGREVSARGLTEAGARVYRRLGLCFMLSAAVLVACLVVPRAFYPLQPGAIAARLSPSGSSLVKDALGGADRAVGGVLRSIGGVDR